MWGREKPQEAPGSRDSDIGAPRPTMNPLGRTGASFRPEGKTHVEPDEAVQRIEELAAVKRHAQQTQSLASILMLLVGGILCGTGVGIWIEWSVGMAVFGLMVFMVGILFGMSA